MTSLTRNAPSGQIDSLSYTYKSGSVQLNKIVDMAVDDREKGYTNANNRIYEQCENGCVAYDPENNATITRDHLNLITSITIPDSNVVINNFRDAQGQWHRREIERGHVKTVIDRINNVEFRNGSLSVIHHADGYITPDFGAASEELFLTGTKNHVSIEEAVTINTDRTLISGLEQNWGQESVTMLCDFEVKQGAQFLADIRPVEIKGFHLNYIIRDHLGSPRVIFSDFNNNNSISTNEVISAHDYYPFGLEWKETASFTQRSTNSPSDSLNFNPNPPIQGSQFKNAATPLAAASIPNYRNSYTDQELIPFSNYLEFDARTYLKAAAVFDGPDPISDQFPHVHSYNYAELSPVTNIDLYGLQMQNASKGQLLKHGLKELGKSLFNDARQLLSSVFKEGSANGNSNALDHLFTDKAVTILGKSGKNSEGSIQPPSGDGSTVIIESDEILAPGAGNGTKMGNLALKISDDAGEITQAAISTKKIVENLSKFIVNSSVSTDVGIDTQKVGGVRLIEYSNGDLDLIRDTQFMQIHTVVNTFGDTARIITPIKN